MKFIEGEKIVFIQKSSKLLDLTENNIYHVYKVIDDDDIQTLVIKNDSGSETCYLSHRFKKLSEVREQRINKLLKCLH